ncbi:carbohydrate ABC transporter ATP-binding protein (CUT1 family) [Rhizobium sp. PP-F2F-G38]|uniref:Sn-glycerol-3-phosphate ABC transporter ATP-binding protein UgpC n=1 Tax=Ferranicluibacter rubi TaxID=2715133 RepID=A0AA43ZEA8_9HYPH|nr:sn-glycerol-3-phosphate ABC transporter ATP-binding protein UgpC [Ferranicluibacter rubi]PYE34005.1 carbohydrate ABC transporter ATP-binding protein (CUT1 family) [Rhizobium sp. PP-WC-1G-195]PYE96641.1 carbohydrate ABC transporter ATP-binding protein (CUT1 family) [Rhizobium sp. PP-F2F-G38]TCP86052.1 carbohydrate ABC transporter ATP-binding protein (CUT1 family) [Rhizobium sp. PP-CC-2G-626]TCQ23674.1 carbohydrate ABC transporter ATP-binding protein (CUT1 family) [Rhizobium sp. PP-CC-3G-465]
MTAQIEIDSVTKRYGAMTVLENLSLSVKANEFMVFLGPSGCGKSTLLRMIAGLESVDEGTISINGERIDTLPPGQRGIAMVFQSYALYPHMTVADNMAFGLKNIDVPKGVIDARLAEAARMLEIGHLMERKPGQLSGGQRQRVAIGRAIVKEPKAFLFDEPLSNLDAALRVRTRVELAQLRNRVKSTMIFVTHDQIEAMTLADRVVVMNNRQIEQIGTPMDIYLRPVSRFVATFVGSPTMNFLPVTLSESGSFLVATLPNGAQLTTTIRADGVTAGEQTLGIRAEAVRRADAGAVNTMPGRVEVLERLGDRTLLYVRLKDGGMIVAEDIGMSRVAIGDEIALVLDGTRTHLFDAEGRARHAEEIGHG